RDERYCAGEDEPFAEEQAVEGDGRWRRIGGVLDAPRRRRPVSHQGSDQGGHDRRIHGAPPATNSNANTAPANGVPKTEPKPPATPATSSRRRSSGPRRKRWEIPSARLAPI